MKTLTLRINQGTPQPQARGRNSGGRRVFSPKTPWFHLVKWEAMKLANHHKDVCPLDGPLKLTVEFLYPRGKSTPKLQALKWTRPDMDNLVKAVKDAFTQGGVWVDDGRVCDTRQIKRYVGDGEPSGAIITVEELEDPAWRRR